MKGLTTLPYEVLSNIASNIDFDDVVALGRTCKAFEFLRLEDSICKSVLQTKLAFSNETQSAMTTGRKYASALRRAAKRRESLATASPFTVATVAIGDAYLYCKGVLCYTLDDRIRLLDVHNSGKHETVINIPALLTRALLNIEDNSTGIFQVLYYSDNIVSCLYKTSGADSDAWLIAFNKTTRRILVTEDLFSTDKIFVRHNHRYLYYGTHSEMGTDGYKKWVIHGFDFATRKWFPEKIHLPDMVGSEVGSTICFEFYNESFYALSNQTSFEVEEIDWTSFYHCIRFPLSSPCKALLEKTENKSMWRRQHQEGPIDDRWTSLRLDVDETSGELKIVESRKEWYLGSSRSQITYYKTDIVFPESCQDEDLDFPYLPLAGIPSTSAFPVSSISTASTSSAGTSTVLSTTPKLHNHDLSSLPDDPLLRLLRPDDNPHHMRPPPRLPHNTHPGNDGSHKPTFTLAKSRIRYYHTSANVYLDLVDDPDPTDWQGTQRLRLRAGSRKLGPPLKDPSGVLRNPSSDLRTAISELYREQPIRYWPDPQDPDRPDDALDEVYRLLNPPTHLGNVHGTADERSLVYVTGGCDQPQAINFVCFDPAIKLAGYKRWGRKGVGEGPHIDGRATGNVVDQEGYVGGVEHFVDVDEADRKVPIDRKGKGKSQAKCATAVQICQRDLEVGCEREQAEHMVWAQGVSGQSWAWTEKAMYLDIGLGFNFDYKKSG